MLSVAAHMLVGRDVEDGSGMSPTHLLYFSQQPKSAWTLVEVDLSEASDPSAAHRITWETSAPFALEDGLLMIGVHVVKDSELLALGRNRPDFLERKTLDLPGTIESEVLASMRRRCKALTGDLKIVVTVPRESALSQQLSRLESYSLGIELCLSKALHQTSVRI